MGSTWTWITDHVLGGVVTGIILTAFFAFMHRLQRAYLERITDLQTAKIKQLTDSQTSQLKQITDAQTRELKPGGQPPPQHAPGGPVSHR